MKSSLETERRSRRGWTLLLIVLSIEAFGGLALLVPTAVGTLQAIDEPLGDRLSVFAGLLLAWVWVLVTLFGGLRSRASWARGSALTIHVLLFAAGTGLLQLGIGETWLAWLLLLLAVVGFVAAMLARPEYEEPTELSDAEAEE